MQMPKRRIKEDDDYFYEDENPSKPSSSKQSKHEEIDPLDAFMCAIDSTAEKQIKQAKMTEKLDKSGKLSKKNLDKLVDEKINKKGLRQDIETVDDEEAYYKWVEENPDKACPQFDDYGNLIRSVNNGQSEEMKKHLNEEAEEEVITFDDDGNVHVINKKKDIAALPMVYHSQKEYQPFKKNFYTEHSSITNLTEVEAYDLKEKLGLKVTSKTKYPKPICSFAHLNLPLDLMKIVRKQGFTTPTPIQSQALPSALSGRDVIGIAQTGSGKTVAFSWPAIIHAADQKRRPKNGPIALIISPTRELCMQTYEDLKTYSAAFNIRPLPLYGGGTMWEQAKHCKIKRPEIIVGTPGRLMDHVQKKNISLENVSYFCIDEADRMFDMGFEYQIRSICNQIRPDRQGLLFSATFPAKIEKLAADVLNQEYVKIVAGDGPGQVNQNIKQTVKIVANHQGKLDYICYNFVKWSSEGSVLIFVTKKDDAEKVGKHLKAYNKNQPGMEVSVMHGDMTQHVRNQVLHDFRLRRTACLVATDVCARGLDIPHIKNVICLSAARNIDTHVHRVGRTGRAGDTGNAIMLIDENEKNDVNFVIDLQAYLEKYYKVSEVPKEFALIAQEAEDRDNTIRSLNLGKRYDDKGQESQEYVSKYEQVLLQQKSKRKYNFRYEFVLPGYEDKNSASSKASSAVGTKRKAYMSSFVQAKETQQALTKERAEELMKANEDLEKW